MGLYSSSRIYFVHRQNVADHLKLRYYVVIELKSGKFLPEYAGKMNFYLNLVDSKLKHKQDNPRIGMILCKNKKGATVE